MSINIHIYVRVHLYVCEGLCMHISDWLFEFHGTSTSIGYSMPNPVYIYELYMICNQFFYMNSLFLYKLTFLLNSCFDPFEPQVGHITEYIYIYIYIYMCVCVCIYICVCVCETVFEYGWVGVRIIYACECVDILWLLDQATSELKSPTHT